MNRIYLISSVALALIIVTLILIYHHIFGITFLAYENALNSLIINLIILVITVLVINLLFSHHHMKINKEKEMKNYIELLSSSHKNLVFQLKTYIITFITREMAITKSENDENYHIIDLTNLLSNLDSYVTSDFIKTRIKITKAGNDNLFDFEESYLTNSQWLIENNYLILSNIHKYLMLYSSLMPNDILRNLVEIELLITKESAFMVPNIKKFQEQLDNSTINAKSVDEIKSQFRKIIKKILEFENKI